MLYSSKAAITSSMGGTICLKLLGQCGLICRTVSFHNFKSQNFKLSVSNPKSKYAAHVSVLSQISNSQGLGRKNNFEILKTYRMRVLVVSRIITVRYIIRHSSPAFRLAAQELPILSSLLVSCFVSIIIIIVIEAKASRHHPLWVVAAYRGWRISLSLYVCMYVCMYVYIYIYTYVYISVSIYLSIYLSIYMWWWRRIVYIYIYYYIR